MTERQKDRLFGSIVAVTISIISFLSLSFIGNYETVAGSDTKLRKHEKEEAAKISTLSTNQQLIMSGLCIINKKTCSIKLKEIK